MLRASMRYGLKVIDKKLNNILRIITNMKLMKNVDKTKKPTNATPGKSLTGQHDATL